ncbi:MAG: hypothetical protein IT462_02025 [Planctomycetes bacterium]|nr:hypothetical protein [Planctomycetota bacterium]
MVDAQPPQPQDPDFAPPAPSGAEGSPWPQQPPYSPAPTQHRFSPPPAGYGAPPPYQPYPPQPYPPQPYPPQPYPPQTRLPMRRGAGIPPPYGGQIPPPYGQYGPPGRIPPAYGQPGYGYFPTQPKSTSPVVWIGLTLFVLSIIGVGVRSIGTHDHDSNPAPATPPRINIPSTPAYRPYEDFPVDKTDKAGGWQLYTSARGNYSIEFPFSPTEKSEPVPSTAGQMWIHSASYVLFEEYYESSYYNLDEPVAPEKVDDYLRTAVSHLEPYLNAKKRQVTLFDQHGNRGIEFEMSYNQTRKPIYGRVVYMPSRVYTLIATTGFGARSLKVSHFLDSFRELSPVLPAPKPDTRTVVKPRTDPPKTPEEPATPPATDFPGREQPPEGK